MQMSDGELALLIDEASMFDAFVDFMDDYSNDPLPGDD